MGFRLCGHTPTQATRAGEERFPVSGRHSRQSRPGNRSGRLHPRRTRSRYRAARGPLPQIDNAREVAPADARELSRLFLARLREPEEGTRD
ncbi:hypothetical protein Sros01_78610 [Streptomyces roseochromogenus]|nr:hypothetical protein Sros01_78610 [Streptomyces roseochromogenus]